MAGYYIQGLLNTETAWDSYCTYGYKSDIDKRYFCAVQTSNVFYASLRESAYINVYIYCKGQQISTLKCISNTGFEYNVSTMSYSTADPTVTRIYEHDVWSNMNGRQTTIADFLSNAPILNGVNLSDTERDALAINYLNNVPEPYGQGTVTLSIKRPGQTLNFISRLLSKTVSKYISEDAVVNINSSPLQIFKDGKFYNTISGFDINNYKEIIFTTGWSYNSLSQYFNTAWGLYARQDNASVFAISNGLIIKQTSGAANWTVGNYAIPINRATGYTALHIRAKILTQVGTENQIVADCVAIVNGQAVHSINHIAQYDKADMADYYCDISDLPYVDYIRLNGADGVPCWEYIALEN